jgi:serine/threonine protein kinase/tetratricopeptide (TPR) repeat protein
MIDRTIAHFRVIEKLGAGGMGEVYKATDTRLDRFVALKFLPADMAHDSHALERFRREAHSASALNHPGICTIYDIGEQDHQPFIAMEFIDGQTLRQHIHGQPLPLEELLDLGIQIADALDVAHAQGIIHRDIKPSNVFVTKRGQAKVLDFGLAKLVPKNAIQLGAEQSSTNAGSHPVTDDSISPDPISVVGVISGTPSYMSPEQVRGDDLDSRADIFALGLLLYEMATGRQAFSGKTTGAIIESILTRSPAAPRTLNPQIPPPLEEIINRCLEKEIDRRYKTAAAVRSDLLQLKRVSDSGQTLSFDPSSSSAVPAATQAAIPPVRPDVSTIAPRPRFRWQAVAAVSASVVTVLAIVAWFSFYSTRHAHALAETDTLLLTDFVNKSGDPIFDDTLRQGLASQLQQSPFLSLVSEQRIQQTLRLMGKPLDSKISPSIAADLCQRTGSKAYLSGSISNMGNQYVIGVSAVNCQTGDSLAQEQVTANGKENVLKALDEASTNLREKLGESLKTVQKLDTPIEQATTPSLEALQAYSLGRKALQAHADYTAAAQLFKHSVELDPKFAMAYSILGTTYSNLGEKNLAAENTRKAYELRGRVSEWEKFYIESHYDHFATGNLEKARQVYDLWSQLYPREGVAHNNLGELYKSLGQYDKALAETHDAVRISPLDGLSLANLMSGYIHLNRLGEARSAADDAIQKTLDTPQLHFGLYQLAFLKKDEPAMAQQVAWATGKPGKENVMLYLEASSAAFAGQLAIARHLSRQAADSAVIANERELAAGYESGAALWEALFGNRAEAQKRLASPLSHSDGRDSQFVAALAHALSGNTVNAAALTADLEKRFPEDTVVRLNYLPTLRAQLALNAPNNGLRGVEILAAASPYELGVPGSDSFCTNLYPVYVRGQAFLAVRLAPQAAAEFQKILAWPGVVFNEPIGALAHLGLARAYTLQGDNSKAKAAYRDFLTLWKDADPDIPILHQAKMEYGDLR